MGEDYPFDGVVKLYIGEQEINSKPQEGVALEYEIPSEEPLKAFGIAKEDSSKAKVSDWESGAFDFNIEFTIDNEDNPLGKWYWNMVRRLRRERKTLLWALTHGYTLRIPCRDDNDNDGYFNITLPSQLRQVMYMTKFIPQYHIFDRNGNRYVIRKCKVVRMKVWPASQELIDKYEKEWEKRK